MDDSLYRSPWKDWTLLASAVRNATQTLADILGCKARGVTLTLDLTAVPGVDTVQLVIEGKDPASGKYYTIAQTAARSTTGTDTLVVYPGIAAVANARVNDVIPPNWRARVVHSAGTNFTYSLGGMLLSN